MKHRIATYAGLWTLGLTLLCAASLASAEETATRRYPLVGHGAIHLEVPQSWRDEVRQPPEHFPPTIVFSPQSGPPFQILLTPMYSVRESMVMPTPSTVKSTVERAAQHARSQAVEKAISVQELKGTASAGYYFSATDRNPKPGEYKYLTQGMLRTGELAPTFTILTNDGAEDILADSLLMLKSAVHMP